MGIVPASWVCYTQGMLSNESFSYVASVARTGAAFDFDALTNIGHRGGHFVITMGTIPGASTATPTIQGQDPATGSWYSILVGAAISSTGTTVLKVYPEIGELAGGAASDLLPARYRVRMAHSAAGSAYNYSIGVNLVP